MYSGMQIAWQTLCQVITGVEQNCLIGLKRFSKGVHGTASTFLYAHNKRDTETRNTEGNLVHPLPNTVLIEEFKSYRDGEIKTLEYNRVRHLIV